MRFNFFTTSTTTPQNDLENKTAQLLELLLGYRQLSAKFWKGWNRHHSEFIQLLLDNKQALSFDQIKLEFIKYVQNAQESIDMKGDFAEICQFLEIQIPESAKQKTSVLSTFFLYAGLLQQGLSAEPRDIGTYPIGF